MRATVILRWFLVAFLAFAPEGHAQLGADPQALAAFAEHFGLRDVAGFIDTVQNLRITGHLPPNYVTKRDANAHGWHGGGLCSTWPGHLIGGDPFDNFAGVLPGPARSYREADLDESCSSRGPKRLIFSADGAIYLTPDHYRHFIQVP